MSASRANTPQELLEMESIKASLLTAAGVSRFLLTRGGTLGGSMRNLAGAAGERKLTRAIIATLSIAGRPLIQDILPLRAIYSSSPSSRHCVTFMH